MNNLRHGWTITDLIVVLALSSFLLAIVLPVLQTRREMARDDVCKNNLVQIGLASLEYDALNGQYPPYVGVPYNPENADEYFDDALDYQLTYSTVQLLPFIDRQDLVDAVDPFAFDFSEQTLFDAGYSTVFTHWLEGIDVERPGVEAIFFDNEISTFRCPADLSQHLTGTILGTHPSNSGIIGTWPVRMDNFIRFGDVFGPQTIVNYVSNCGSMGITNTPSNPDWYGLWGPIRSRESNGIDDVEDGAANVILFGEHLGNIDNKPPHPIIANARTAGLGGVAIGRADIYGITDGHDPFPFLGTAKKSHWIQFGAPHPDSLNILRCDGSVQAMGRNIQPETFGRLCGVADGLPLFDGDRD